MKTFKEEHAELFEWYAQKCTEYDNIPWDGISHDGGGSAELRNLTVEYHKKLKVLKQKYNIDQTA